jgi:hypothetical protein
MRTSGRTPIVKASQSNQDLTEKQRKKCEVQDSRIFGSQEPEETTTKCFSNKRDSSDKRKSCDGRHKVQACFLAKGVGILEENKKIFETRMKDPSFA